MIKLSNIFAINNPSDIEVQHYVLQQGLACIQGQLTLSMDFVLVDHLGTIYPVHVEPLAFWPDQSIRWLQINTIVALAAQSQHTFSLHQSINDVIPSQLFCNIDQENTVNVHCAEQVININHNGITNEQWSLNFILLLDDVERTDFTIISIKEYIAQAALFCDVQCALRVYCGTQCVINNIKIRVIYATGEVYIESVLHNPAAAQHPNGTWDLGDPNSVMIDHWGCLLKCNSSKTITTQLHADSAYSSASKLKVEQLSSGGKHWDSDAHIDQSLTSPITHPYTLVDGEPSSFTRVEPTVHISEQRLSWYCQLTHFWQKFPSTLDIKQSHTDWCITWGFHSAAIAPLNELQPGERWQRTLLLTHLPCAVITAITVILEPHYLSTTGALELFHQQQLNSPLQPLLRQGLTGKSHYYNKRETADMFGFRHFGEIYADHEAEHHTGDKAFISFYNNQYDPLLGLIKQGLLTQDPRYMTLAQDLAEHIVHIDIYHTQLDKPEYNGGLFWHTDHYLPALSSTHRTYSQHHQADAYEDHAGGGGPGGQHCYSTGLLYYYFLTGDPYAKEAVISLYRWIEQVYDGDHSMVGLILAIKNRHRVDLKNITTNTYPLDRGTANYINATLDMYLLLHDQYYLHKAFDVILHTVNLSEDLTLRRLDDVEHNWFYTVFLQAVCRFMRLCQTFPITTQEHQLWLHCQQLVIKFADWMVAYEYPYLTKPEVLEYPNQTWSGQDLRKVDILSFAAYINPTKQKVYQQKATELEQYVLTKLSASEETGFSRIQALIMQNYGGNTLYTALNSESQLNINVNKHDEACTAHYLDIHKKTPIHQIALHNLRDWSIKHEINQLKKRSQRFNKWIH